MGRAAWSITVTVACGCLSGAWAGCSLLLGGDLSGGEVAGPATSGEDGAPSREDGSVGEAAANTGDAEDGLSEYAKAVLADHPVAYFHFDEPAGANFVRDVVTGAEAPVIGKLELGVPGAVGSAARFDGSQVVEVGPVFDFAGIYSYSLELWADPLTNQDGMEGISRLSVEPVKGYSLHFSDGESRAKPSFWIGGAGSTTAWWDPDLPPGLVHIVVTATNVGGEGRANLYVNAEKSPKGDFANATAEQESTTALLRLGRKFVGRLDEVAIYDHVLPPSRVFEHYRAGAGR